MTLDVCIAMARFAFIDKKLRTAPKTMLNIALGKTQKDVRQGFTLMVSTECRRRQSVEADFLV
jgi:hypothetical protein